MFHFWSGKGIFYFHSVHAQCGAHLASYPTYMTPFQKVKLQETPFLQISFIILWADFFHLTNISR